MTTPYAPPGNEIEKQLARIFQGFLGFEKVGIHDDFFELGGDSLKAMTILSHIGKSMEMDIPLAEFFNKPFIKGLAEYIAGGVSEGVEKYPVFLEPVEEKEYYALSSAQRRLYVLQRMETHGSVYNMPSMMDLEGAVDKDRFQDIFSKLIHRHERQRGI
jgi:acyl carrier protein